jgi:hypothetical protein
LGNVTNSIVNIVRERSDERNNLLLHAWSTRFAFGISSILSCLFLLLVYLTFGRLHGG